MSILKKIEHLNTLNRTFTICPRCEKHINFSPELTNCPYCNKYLDLVEKKSGQIRRQNDKNRRFNRVHEK